MKTETALKAKIQQLHDKAARLRRDADDTDAYARALMRKLVNENDPQERVNCSHCSQTRKRI